MRPRKITLPVLLLIIFCGLPSVYCLGAFVQMNYFFLREREAASKFDALNEAVLNEVPPPDGVVETKRLITGTNISPANHGRTLSVDYPMGNLSEEQISSYYTGLLLSKGWQVFHNPARNIGLYQFFRGTACLDLSIYPKMTPTPEYSIYIWYDLWSQPFSPPKPNLVLLNLFEFEVTSFSLCTSSSRY